MSNIKNNSSTLEQLKYFCKESNIDKCFEKAKNNCNKSLYWMIIFSEELIRKAINIELNSKFPILWRFTQDKYEDTIKLSFSNGLLSGFINDSRYSPLEGLTNFSACTLSYWLNHQLITSEKWRNKNNISLNKMPDEYKEYINNKNKHELYGVQLYKNINNKDIQIINNNSSALDSLQGQGESFHPKITCKDNIEQVFDIIQLWNGLEFNYYEKTEYLE